MYVIIDEKMFQMCILLYTRSVGSIFSKFFFQFSTERNKDTVDLLNPSPYLIGKPRLPPLSLVANSIRGNNGAQEARINAHFIKGITRIRVSPLWTSQPRGPHVRCQSSPSPFLSVDSSSKRTNQRSPCALLRPASRGHACQYRVDTLVRSTLILSTRLLSLSTRPLLDPIHPQNGSPLPLPSIRHLSISRKFYCSRCVFPRSSRCDAIRSG